MTNIGVFWCFQGQVFGEPTSLDEASQAVSGLLDSIATHVEVWDEHNQFRVVDPILGQYDYQEVPRGRVLYQVNKQRVLVYLDRTLMTKSIKVAIADYFGFVAKQADWKSDLHYTTDSTALSKLLDD
ncbi:hypothetical protein [Idiomarina aminovorans]|uniref:hypothetical protein n=1 Tax=Idiomarina aminovorans TaxID=2914829 RepID=UPI002006A327|nr:hypothetical protein [Idiomarina sp. ATCH4]MCK7460016.1 hypothetical protein [Idiomarina sp. ATCH4]